jgi:hypothetical protein
MKIFEKLLELYKNYDVELELSKFGDFMKPVGRDTGYSITKKEVEYFSKYSHMFEDPNIFIVGNAFGFSTFCFYYIFKNCKIDVIDSETEGDNNKDGTILTKKIYQQNSWNIELYSGFSPHDVAKAARLKEYDIVFIDGYHSNDQIVLDFDAIKPFLKEKYICFFHDVGFLKLENGFNKILNLNNELYDRYQLLPYDDSQSGIGIISKGYEIII